MVLVDKKLTISNSGSLHSFLAAVTILRWQKLFPVILQLSVKYAMKRVEL